MAILLGLMLFPVTIYMGNNDVYLYIYLQSLPRNKDHTYAVAYLSPLVTVCTRNYKIVGYFFFCFMQIYSQLFPPSTFRR